MSRTARTPIFAAVRVGIPHNDALGVGTVDGAGVGDRSLPVLPLTADAEQLTGRAAAGPEVSVVEDEAEVTSLSEAFGESVQSHLLDASQTVGHDDARTRTGVIAFDVGGAVQPCGAVAVAGGEGGVVSWSEQYRVMTCAEWEMEKKFPVGHQVNPSSSKCPYGRRTATLIG